MPENDADPRWEAVIGWFGYKPNFHDCEVLSVELRRAPEPSAVRVHAWRTLEETEANGVFRCDRHAIVSFVLKDIVRLELRGWNHQNVLSRIHVIENPEGAILALEDIYGVEGEIVAREILVEIEPYSPSPHD